MHYTSHTTPAGVICRVHFNESDSAVFGLTGEGWFDFDNNGVMWDYQADFQVDSWKDLNVGILLHAREYLAGE